MRYGMEACVYWFLISTVYLSSCLVSRSLMFFGDLGDLGRSVSIVYQCNILVTSYQLTSELRSAARVISKWVHRDPAITISHDQSYFASGLA